MDVPDYKSGRKFNFMIQRCVYKGKLSAFQYQGDGKPKGLRAKASREVPSGRRTKK